MTQAQPQRIAIIGGGVSGALTAVHLSRIWHEGPWVTVFERRSRDARGLAYDTFEPGHLLNVRASNMSAFPDEPKHFERWLAQQGAFEDEVRHTEAGSFASRRLYGRYLEQVLRSAGLEGRGRTVRVVHGDVSVIRRRGEAFDVRLHDGRAHSFDGVVLAMGNVTECRSADGPVFGDPWSPGATMDLDPGRPVLIQGTGLTMVDTVIALRRQGFRGRIFALSRRGLMPQVHAAVETFPTRRVEDVLPASSLTALLRRVRRDVEDAADAGACWRAPFDALRGITQELWLELPLAEKARFLRHARPYWEVHRHRLAPPVARLMEQERAAGTLKILAGRVQELQAGARGVTVTFRPRGGGAPVALEAQRLIVATGIPDLAAAHDPFIEDLVVQGIARFDPLGLGLDVDRTLGVRDGEGERVPGLWALGPLVRGVFWECIAVPDIRRQAAHVAHAVAAALRRRMSGGLGRTPAAPPPDHTTTA